MTDRTINICMIGHGMMGTWHSEALRDHSDCVLHTIAGKDQEEVQGFARRFGYRSASTDFAASIADPAIDAVIVASPSEDHARMTKAAIEARKPVLVEIPLAMTLESCENLVLAAEDAGVTLAVCHPMRFRACRVPLIARVAACEERVLHVHGRFFIHRLVNIGATGIRRTWTDNILWHHTTHLVDFGLFVAGGGDPHAAERRIRRVEGFMPDIDSQTGIPMEIAVIIETKDGCTIAATGSYHARERIYEMMTVTGRDSYRVDEIAATMTTGGGTQAIETEQENAWRVARDFVDALRENRSPFVTGRSVLPAMRVLDRVQQDWDTRYGARSLPGRPLDSFATP
ncbi:Gfo/Idh/MocA family oxidoreductase [Acidiphilium sp. AL]|uniref:Gfo/Idh/MocA family oxidoreductase n=1 Tax=Acidiphilium iwatense TaxID=768198 RepID=A0ABS9E251_9PROT|nr:MULTISPECIES: Gfo/Idh/MocA family oxidoreductase [Acidiphilium]MCF3948115.1 Gfo/Idh/MocA family oxidoreductase [Acidiphilium iwatense]MCU4161502.1 Gfo/Idh/MocA family oxidoreductase [Acidiphilium sp. AL]